MNYSSESRLPCLLIRIDSNFAPPRRTRLFAAFTRKTTSLIMKLNGVLRSGSNGWRFRSQGKRNAISRWKFRVLKIPKFLQIVLLPEGKFDQLDRVGCNFVSDKREVLAAKDFYWLARGGQQSLEFNRSPFVATAARKRRRKENAASVRLLC